MTNTASNPNHVGLRALEAVLRLGGLSAAARELGVTPAAISHRLRDLDATAGMPLLRREGGRFVATEAGRTVALALGDAFARIRQADAALVGLAARPQIRIVAPMSFTVLWLLPRLAEFEAAYPEITPYISAATDPLRREAEADIRICHSTAPPAGQWLPLLPDATAVAAAPGTIFPAEAGTVLTMRAIHIETPGGRSQGTFGWADWAAARGLSGGLPAGPHVSAEHAAADLAMQGKGIMLASLMTLADAIVDGRLSVMSQSGIQTGIGYWMQIERTGPVVRAFAEWIGDALARHRTGPMAQAMAMAGLGGQTG